MHEQRVQVPGATLSVLHLHLRLREPRGVVSTYGNAGNLAGWFSDATFYREAGYDLVMPDYRGYIKSTGRIGSTPAGTCRTSVGASCSCMPSRTR